MPVSTDVRITLQDEHGTKAVLVPYGTTIHGLRAIAKLDRPIYNQHGKELPDNIPLRGPATFRLAPML